MKRSSDKGFQVYIDRKKRMKAHNRTAIRTAGRTLNRTMNAKRTTKRTKRTYSAKELSEELGVSDVTIRTRWFEWVSNVCDESNLKAKNRQYTAIAADLLRRYKADCIDIGIEGKPRYSDKTVWIVEMTMEYAERIAEEAPAPTPTPYVDAEFVDDNEGGSIEPYAAGSALHDSRADRVDAMALRFTRIARRGQSALEALAEQRETAQRESERERRLETLMDVVEEVERDAKEREAIRLRLETAKADGNFDEVAQTLFENISGKKLP